MLERLRDRLAGRPDLVGVYVYGSLVTGDFSPARSDIDVVVLLDREPGEAAAGELRELHQDLRQLGGAAGQLHCLYVAAEHAADPDRLCLYWFGDRMTQWQMKVMTQAEISRRAWRCTGRGRRPASGRSPSRTSRRRCWRRCAATGAGSPAPAGTGWRMTPSIMPSSCCPGLRPCWLAGA